MTRNKQLQGLERLRDKIDILDGKIVSLLSKRLKLVDRLAPFKTAIKDSARERKVIAMAKANALAAGIPPWYAHDIIKAIIAASTKHQKQHWKKH